MAPNRTRVETKTLTPQLAKEFATMTPMPGERDLNKSHKSRLHILIKARKFVGVDWAVARNRKTGEEFRADGQHSSVCLTELEPKDFPDGLQATIAYYEYDPGEEAEVFNIFNNPMTVRSNEDAMGVYRAAHHDLEKVDKKTLVRLAAGLAFHNDEAKAARKNRLAVLRKNPEKNAAAIAELEAVRDAPIYPVRDRGLYWRDDNYRRFALWANEFADMRNAWLLGQQGIVAEMLEDFQKSSMAKEFWGYVMAENHPSVDDDTRELANLLNDWRRAEKKKEQTEFRKKAAGFFKKYRIVREAQLANAANAIEATRAAEPESGSEHSAGA
jgi:hypothetical protein